MIHSVPIKRKRRARTIAEHALIEEKPIYFSRKGIRPDDLQTGGVIATFAAVSIAT
jgi:hypothetical protein